MGGWSKGFHALGFRCIGVDIVDVGYPYELILQDVRTLDGRRFRGFDVIVGSPPCRDFSYATYFGWKYWKDKPNPSRGMELVLSLLRIIRQAKPRFWIMENTPILAKYLVYPQCRGVVKLTPYMRRALWGNFPNFPIPMDMTKPRIQDFKGKLRAWKRAEIPLCVSKAFAQAIVDCLE